MKKVEILLALAEEDPQGLMVIRSALEKKYQITTETGDESALERIRINKFDLVVTDLLTVLEKAKELNPRIMAILVLATSSKSVSTVHAIRSSADDYLFRPFGLAEMEMRISHCIEKLQVSLRDPPPESFELSLNEKMLNMVKALSHDVRGSLLSISATLKLLSRGHYGNMDETVVHRIRELFSKTSGLIGVMEEYLGRSFSVDNDLNTEVESLDLMKDVLIPVLRELSSELKGHRLMIDHRLHAMSNKPISIRTNGIWLKMVFRNLLRNATKYGDMEGMIAIGFEDRGSSYRLNVYNSGKPVPEEYRERLFTKCVGGMNGRNGRGGAGGTGLGLYLVGNVIQKLGGKIWYEAKENGSNFIFTLPPKPASSRVEASLPTGTQLQMASVNS
jgi:signal transduction histidine kinase